MEPPERLKLLHNKHLYVRDHSAKEEGESRSPTGLNRSIAQTAMQRDDGGHAGAEVAVYGQWKASALAHSLARLCAAMSRFSSSMEIELEEMSSIDRISRRCFSEPPSR